MNAKNCFVKYTLVIFALLTVIFAVSCSGSSDIEGYYTCDGLENVYHFTSDGKIYVNGEEESYSHYEVKGGKIITYIEGDDSSRFEFDFKKTDEGFTMGELEYRRLPDYTPTSDEQKE